jgi:hypothetical protein
MVNPNQRPPVLEKTGKTRNLLWFNGLQRVKNLVNQAYYALVNGLNSPPIDPNIILYRLEATGVVLGLAMQILFGFYRVKFVSDMTSAPPAGMYTDNGGLIWP